MKPEILSLGQILWDYHKMNHKLKKADAIWALGSNNLTVAKVASQLYLDGWAPLLIFSGGIGPRTQIHQPESHKFRDIALQMGIPKEAIIIEDKSTNSSENILFTKELLENQDTNLNHVILVQKPYMERRAYATTKKRWPELEITMASENISFEDYLKNCKDYPEEKHHEQYLINAIVGDTQRIIEYPKLGYQIEQPMPDEVFEAYKKLIDLGYNKRLIG